MITAGSCSFGVTLRKQPCCGVSLRPLGAYGFAIGDYKSPASELPEYNSERATSDYNYFDAIATVVTRGFQKYDLHETIFLRYCQDEEI